jgi:signal transduction histidine kinase/ligand-binding sensor domain-containing protein
MKEFGIDLWWNRNENLGCSFTSDPFVIGRFSGCRHLLNTSSPTNTLWRPSLFGYFPITGPSGVDILPILRMIRFLLFFLLPNFFNGLSLAQSGHATYYKDARFFSLTINEGLSQNFITAIHQDHLGFIWIGTRDGLNMYDGYRFTIYKHDPFDSNTLSDNFIQAVYSDAQGRLWIGTMGGGLNLFDRKVRQFRRFSHDPRDAGSISSNHVQAIVGDLQGNIWIGTSGGGLNKLTLEAEGSQAQVTRFSNRVEGVNLGDASVSSLIIDAQNTLWIGTAQDIFAANITSKDLVFRRVPYTRASLGDKQEPRPARIQDGEIHLFTHGTGELWMCNGFGLFKYEQDQQVFAGFVVKGLPSAHTGGMTATGYHNRGFNEIWMSCGESLYVVNTMTLESYELRHNKNNRGGLQKGGYSTLFVDRGGSMWIGSNGHGLTIFDPYAMKFVYPNDLFAAGAQRGLSSRDLSIRAFSEVGKLPEYLWIGASEGFFRIHRNRAEITPVELTTATGSDPPIVYSIQSDETGNLWLGTSGGLVWYNPDNGHQKLYATNFRDSLSGEDPRVPAVMMQGADIWVLTANTIALFDKNTGSFEHIRYHKHPVNNQREPVLPCWFEDNKGNFWLGTPNGLLYFDVKIKKVVEAYEHDPKNSKSLNFNSVRAILPDPLAPNRYLWLGTAGGGLNRLDLQDRSFKYFTEWDGLANNTITGMLTDGFGNFWISTSHGISKFQVEKELFTNYNSSDGLQSNEFNSGASYVSYKGEMFFGGINGYNTFYPSQIQPKAQTVSVIFTTFRLLTHVAGESFRDSSLHIEELDQLSLKYNQNHFSIEFSALEYATSGENEFVYSLTTYGEEWIPLGNSHVITFTDMKPGTYTLKVRGINHDGIESNQVASLIIHIARPWWNGNAANAVYIALFLLGVFGLRQYELLRFRLKNRIKMAALESIKLKEIDQLKSQFFANISHEFRTPLTLIKGPLEQLMDDTQNPEKQETYHLMHGNVMQLLSLINQLLDLSKLENGLYRIKVSRGDIVALLKAIILSFSAMMDQKQINWKFFDSSSIRTNAVSESFYFDRDVIEKIVSNLLSNAVKFTPGNGKITMCVCMKRMGGNPGVVEIVVRDTGIGIPKDKLPYIYDRFYQVEVSPHRSHEGSGVGLAFVKELVNAHKGTVAVKSTPGEGTTFRVRFPMGRAPFAAGQFASGPEGVLKKERISSRNHPLTEFEKGRSHYKAENPLVLVVEDHDEVRQYIRQSIERSFNVVEAPNALEGIRLATEMIPDLIISDIMMPGMDGFQCKRSVFMCQRFVFQGSHGSRH